jgi:peptidoglycan hydrolase-like protein with peptidoglycan-binding domain
MRLLVFATFGVLLFLAPLRADYVEGIAAFKRGDYAAAHREFLAPAAEGRAAPQFNLGFLYHHGLGVDKDPARAVEWYRKAAEQGLVEAQFSLGTLYETGTGVPRDLVAAYNWYNRSAGNVPLGETRDRLMKHRDRVAAQLSPGQLAAAETAPVPDAEAPAEADSDSSEGQSEGASPPPDEPGGQDASNPRIAEIQRRLEARGFDPGPIDGRMGRRTVASLSVFQAAHGLAITGQPDEPTLRKLFGPEEVAPKLEPFPRTAATREESAPPAVPVPPVETTTLDPLDQPSEASPAPAAEPAAPAATAAQSPAPATAGDVSSSTAPTAVVRGDDITTAEPDRAVAEDLSPEPEEGRGLAVDDGDRADETLTAEPSADEPANTAPSELSLAGGAVAENAPGGALVGKIGATDPDPGDRLAYSLVEDAGGRFVIDAETGTVTVAEGARLDFEAAAGHEIRVRVTDAGGLGHEAVLAISVEDINEAPRLEEAAFELEENAPGGGILGRVGASDPDAGETLAYSLTEDAGGRFAIDAETGTVTVAEGARLDFEDSPVVELTVAVSDRGGLGPRTPPTGPSWAR